MSVSLTWLGHGGWLIESTNHKILLDPFVSQSPTATVSKDDLPADYILVSHGHFDHIVDVPDIAKRTSAPVISIYEITQWLEATHNVANGIGMNIGGGVTLPFGHVKMTPALHSSQLPDGTYGGEPVGFVVTIEDQRIYFACDTGLFSDMKLIGEMGITLAVLPIGDLFTMGPEDSIAAIKLINPRKVAPAHFNTWPPIEQDVSAWADQVKAKTSATPIVIDPGESFEI